MFSHESLPLIAIFIILLLCAGAAFYTRLMHSSVGCAGARND